LRACLAAFAAGQGVDGRPPSVFQRAAQTTKDESRTKKLSTQ
jgi:hypothetical protein